jgi:type IX secretion system PorP/SprF family membrane protein
LKGTIYLQLLAFVVLLHSGTPAGAQDAAFSQFYSNPLYLNPAFTGTLAVPRINLQYRDQWHSLSKAYVTQSVSFDVPVEAIRGGLGFNLVKDSQADNLLKSLQVDLMYSSIFRLTTDFWFSGAIQAGYRQNSLDWYRLVFPDNLDPYAGSHTVTAETPVTDPNYQYFDFATGVLVFGERLFAGLAAHHLAQPEQSYYKGSESGSVLKRRFSLHFGTRIPVHVQGSYRKTFDLSPQVVLLQQGSNRQFNYGLLANYRGLTAGTWFRQDFTFHYDALILLVGYMKKRWHFTYSYDFTVSGIGAQSGGTSEISLGFLLKDFTTQTAFPFFRPYKDYIGE